MSSPASGVGQIELALLDAMDLLGAHPSNSTVKTDRVLVAVDSMAGIAPQLAYEALTAGVDTSLVHVPLYEPRGNFGSRVDPPANPRYTEVRMSTAGHLVFQLHQRGEATLPIGLINGNVHLGGTRPAFDPHRVLDAVERAATDPKVEDGELDAIIGPPSFPGGCDVNGDVAALLAGEACDLRLQAVLTQLTDQGRPSIAITCLSPLSSPLQIFEDVQTRARNPRRLERFPQLDQTMLPISDLSDESMRGTFKVLLRFDRGTDLDEVESRLRQMWSVARTVAARLPQPIADTIRSHAQGDATSVLAALQGLRAALDPR